MSNQPPVDKTSNHIYGFTKHELDKIDSILDEIAKERNSTVFALLYSSLTSMLSIDLHKIYGKFTSIVKNSDKDRIDIVLHTMGGDADAAFQLGYAIQKYVDELQSRRGKEMRLNTIVPRSVKSAGTLLALCADCVVLTRLSELGPIDPQIRTESGYVSAKTIRDSLRQVLEIVSELKTGTEEIEVRERIETATTRYVLSRIPVVEMGHYESLLNHIVRLAQELLKNRMMRNESNEQIHRVSEQLVKGYEYHGFPITFWHLKNMGISCEIVDSKLEDILLELYDILVRLDTKFLYIYSLRKLGSEFIKMSEEIAMEFIHEVVELRNGIIVLPLPSSYIEKSVEEFLANI